VGTKESRSFHPRRVISFRMATFAKPKTCHPLSNHLSEQLFCRNVKRFRGGLVFKAHRLCVSLNSRLESNKEAEEAWPPSSNPKHSIHSAGPVDPSFRALSGRLKFTVRRHKFNTGSLLAATFRLSSPNFRAGWSNALGQCVQGYLAPKKTPTPLGPPNDPRHRPAVGS